MESPQISTDTTSLEELEPRRFCRLVPESLNAGVKEMQYDVRGEIYLAAQAMLAEGKEVIFTNVGNPHAMGQKPLTFPRQVMALCTYPALLDMPDVLNNFAVDAIQR